MKSLLQYPTNKVATISDTIKITSTINIYLYILFLIDKNLCFEKYTSNNNVKLSNDATLKSLSIDGVSISPEFKSDIFEYMVEVAENTEKSAE